MAQYFKGRICGLVRVVTCHRHVGLHFMRLFFCRFRMKQSKIISSTDAMFAIVVAGKLWHNSHCPLDDVLRNIHNNAESGQRYEG